MRVWLLVVIFSLNGCAWFAVKNPSIIYSLQAKDEKKRTPPAEILIYKTGELQLYFKILSNREVAEHLLNMGEVRDFPDNTRIPPLTFIRYRAVNQGNSPVKINFLKSYFVSGEKSFPALEPREYEKMFTSASYKTLTFERLFSIYVTKRNNITPKEISYYEKIKPEHVYHLASAEEALQLVAYPRLSGQERSYRLFIQSGEEEITLDFQLQIIRSDREP